jgi:hypothetical protein
MALDTEEIEHIYVQVMLGTPKDQYPQLSEDGSRFWDELAAEVERRTAENPDIDWEAPDIELPTLPPWVAEAPEAPAAPPPPPPDVVES